LKLKIKDKFILGAFSGAATTTVLNFVDYLSLALHVNNLHIWQIAGSLYYTQEELKSVVAIVLGGITHTTLTSFVGIIICYTLYFTGRSFYIIKGIVICLLFWIMLFGGTLRLGITSLPQPLGITTNLAHFTGHVLLGVITSILIVKFADEKTWGDR